MPEQSEPSQSPRMRRRWALLSAAATLIIGGVAMYLSWGLWGVFVTCSSVTLVGTAAAGLLLLPRAAVTGMLVAQVASCAVWFMLVGWGLVALLYPEYTVGWRFPGKGTGGMRIHDAGDALWVGWTVLSTGAAFAVLIITVEILPRIRAARSKR